MTVPADVTVMPSTKYLVLSALMLAACDLPVEDDVLAGDRADEERSDTKAPLVAAKPTAELTLPVADMCDDPTYANVDYVNARSSHFVIYFFPGTAAERDHEAILARLELAYDNVRTALGVQALPVISVYLSPNRQAAAAHGRAYGRAYYGQDRYEVIYTGAAGSYELQRYGHELTHIFEYYLDTSARRHPMLSEGTAEYNDHSGRDMHEAYAQQLLAGSESRVRVATFDTRDVTASNYGRAGSLVQLLIERYGQPKFLEIFRAATVTWNYTTNCWSRPSLGCISTPDALAAMLDEVLVATVGERWSAVQAAWEGKVQEALASVDNRLSRADEAEIKNLVQVMDLAMTTGDATTYRRTMDGFYCEAGTDAARTAIANRAVTAFAGVSSRVEAIAATGIKNFRSAIVSVRRTDAQGRSSFVALYVEHFPAGWRVTYGPDWY